jgi:DNA polymerase sigma
MVISFLQRHPKIAAGHIKAEENLGALLIEILELYGTRFNFDRVGIAIDHGGSYFQKLDYQALNVNMWRRICVRDPNDPNNNIAKASHQTDSIIKVFNDAYRDLTNRCYLVDASIKRGETAPWVTNCGSILDAIIESPQVVGRERLSGLWKEDWEDAPDPKPPIPPPPTSNPSNKDKPTRKKQQASQKAARKRARKQKAANDIQPSIIIPPATKSSFIPIKRKAPTAVSSNGTKDTPIVLDDSSPTSPLAAPPKSNSPRKKKKGLTLERVDQAITNLGSISGRARDTITID